MLVAHAAYSLDKCVPRPLRRELSGHEVRTVVEMGWAGKQNGELLRLLTAEHFAVFLTTDQNLRYQQNFRGLQVAVVVLVAPTNRLDDLLADTGGPHGAWDHSGGGCRRGGYLSAHQS